MRDTFNFAAYIENCIEADDVTEFNKKIEHFENHHDSCLYSCIEHNSINIAKHIIENWKYTNTREIGDYMKYTAYMDRVEIMKMIFNKTKHIGRHDVHNALLANSRNVIDYIAKEPSFSIEDYVTHTKLSRSRDSINYAIRKEQYYKRITRIEEHLK